VTQNRVVVTGFQEQRSSNPLKATMDDTNPALPELPSQNTTKPCKVCGEEIKLSAKKCIHCDTFQDWRSSLSFSTTVLSLLVALVSVLTAAIPVLNKEFTGKYSSLNFSYQSASQKYIFILASNTGNRPGTIRGGTLSIGDLNLPLGVGDVDINSVFIIDENKNVLVKFSIGSSENYNIQEFSHRFKDSTYLKNLSCSININHTNFSGASETSNVKIPNCVDFAKFVTLHP
jgi:hypothetical protein